MLNPDRGRVVLQNDNYYYIGYKFGSSDVEHFIVDDQSNIGFIAPSSQKIIEYERLPDYDQSANYDVSFMPGFYNEKVKADQKISLLFGETMFQIFNDVIEVDPEEKEKRLNEVKVEYMNNLSYDVGLKRSKLEKDLSRFEKLETEATLDDTFENNVVRLSSYEWPELRGSENLDVAERIKCLTKRSPKTAFCCSCIGAFDYVMIAFTFLVSAVYFLYDWLYK